MATQLARWTKAGRWENSVIVEASPDSDGWRNRVTLFMPGERTTINYQLRKRAHLTAVGKKVVRETRRGAMRTRSTTDKQFYFNPM